MRGRDRCDDRQAEAVAVAVSEAIGSKPVEGLQQPLDLLAGRSPVRCWRPQDRLPALGRGRDLDPAAGDVVAHGVVEEVRHEALDQARIADRRRRSSCVSRRSPRRVDLRRGARSGPRSVIDSRSTAAHGAPGRARCGRASAAPRSAAPAARRSRARARRRRAASWRWRRGRRASPRGSPAPGSAACAARARRWRRTGAGPRTRTPGAPSSSSKVSPSSRSSSLGPSSARRSCRLEADSSRAVVVIACSGRSTRPASNHPSAIEATTMIARAKAEPINS